VTGLLAFAMNRSDRYFLRASADMTEVGIYSLAVALGQGVNTLVLMPFLMSWEAVKFEIADRPDSRKVDADVFHYSMTALMLVLLAVSLFARPVLTVMVSPEYLESAEVVPLICLAYVFFSAGDFLTFPAALHNQTGKLVPASLAGVAANL